MRWLKDYNYSKGKDNEAQEDVERWMTRNSSIWSLVVVILMVYMIDSAKMGERLTTPSSIEKEIWF